MLDKIARKKNSDFRFPRLILHIPPFPLKKIKAGNEITHNKINKISDQNIPRQYINQSPSIYVSTVNKFFDHVQFGVIIGLTLINFDKQN